MSDTPRTDEHSGWLDATGCVIGWRDKVPTEFARQLERENTSLLESRNGWRMGAVAANVIWFVWAIMNLFATHQ